MSPCRRQATDQATSGTVRRQPLVLVSNHAPASFAPGDATRRDWSDPVTMLSGAASQRDAVWIASAMAEQDADLVRRRGGAAFEVQSPGGGTYRLRLVASAPEAYERFSAMVANPLLWFTQHYLWDLSRTPEIRLHEVEAFDEGYQVVNRDLARAVLGELKGVPEPIVMVHDYHLYTLPALIRAARPDAFLHHFVHVPWPQSDAWRVLPARIRDELFRGVLANDIVGFPTRSYRRNFLGCCRDLLGLAVDDEQGVIQVDGREVWARSYPVPIDAHVIRAAARWPRVAELAHGLQQHRRASMILRVDRADPSTNVLRGFRAFDIFLEQHPEFAEQVTFVAQLTPSRTDLPAYADYLERIEALVTVVNHRHGTPDWMPIQLKLRDDPQAALAAYEHYDALLVNPMFDGMNLAAKQGPLVNQRDGVPILSENTGSREELGEFALSVNPFDVQETADALHRALTMPLAERAARAEGLKRKLMERDPGDWIDEQLADMAAKGRLTRI